GDQVFADERAIAVGGVDEVHAEFGQSPERSQSLRPVLGLAPDALAGDAHGAEAQTGYGDISADAKWTGRCGGRGSGHGEAPWLWGEPRRWAVAAVKSTRRPAIPGRCRDCREGSG